MAARRRWMQHETPQLLTACSWLIRGIPSAPLQRLVDYLLATGNWQLATGNWQLATGNWQLAAGNWRPVSRLPVTPHPGLV
ncbi:hypothetical protein BDV95DRAFT_235594 [Massariosphaeria phaeospora]|uniref:Uncharacterized protein n=1 Tax=Massariosphaeria phaeospora TaxID=100035 RepID=A0A7C8MHV6_9PLEO|nr:hypothetical protein BDV95DRAFT_235594 [Massariosphaeria phaeospora]